MYLRIETWNGFSCLIICLLINLNLIKQKLNLEFLILIEYFYKNIPLTEMLSGLKVAKKHVHVYLLSLKALHMLGFVWHAWKCLICPEG